MQEGLKKSKPRRSPPKPRKVAKTVLISHALHVFKVINLGEVVNNNHLHAENFVTVNLCNQFRRATVQTKRRKPGTTISLLQAATSEVTD
jgi:hypothetical protein